MQRKHLGNSWDSYYLINKRETMQAGVQVLLHLIPVSLSNGSIPKVISNLTNKSKISSQWKYFHFINFHLVLFRTKNMNYFLGNLYDERPRGLNILLILRVFQHSNFKCMGKWDKPLTKQTITVNTSLYRLILTNSR